MVNRSFENVDLDKGLTPELSRAERGGWEPVLPACLQDSTKPRNGVGLNDLLGGTEPRDAELQPRRPKAEAQPLRRAPRTYSRSCPKQRIRRGKPVEGDRHFRSRPTQRMRSVSAHSGLGRRRNGPKNRPKSNADRRRQVAAPTIATAECFSPPNA